MQSLRDKARELVSIAEGEFLKKEAVILALRRELEETRIKLFAKEARSRLGGRPPACEGCIYRVLALKNLKETEAGDPGCQLKTGKPPA